MDVAEGEHVREGLFLFRIEAAGGVIGGGVMKGAEEEIPEGEIGVVLAVVEVLVMDAMGLRSLDEPAEPVRGADIPVVEVLGDGGEGGVE